MDSLPQAQDTLPSSSLSLPKKRVPWALMFPLQNERFVQGSTYVLLYVDSAKLQTTQVPAIKTDLPHHVWSSIIPNSQNVEATHVSIDG